jgi:exopolyphosphatase/guanosine-5'-triphosphate,3'-diphosphate pyrophosphatase
VRFGAMMREVKRALESGLPPALRGARPAPLVGTAGTVTTLAALDLGLRTYDADRVQGHRLARRAVEAVLQRLGGLTLEERAALPCLPRGRAAVILPGTAIVLTTMALLGVETLVASDRGLREGILVDLAASAGHRV